MYHIVSWLSFHVLQNCLTYSIPASSSCYSHSDDLITTMLTTKSVVMQCNVQALMLQPSCVCAANGYSNFIVCANVGADGGIYLVNSCGASSEDNVYWLNGFSQMVRCKSFNDQAKKSLQGESVEKQ